MIVLDAGDLLFPEESLLPGEVPQRRVKAELILEANEKLGVEAVAVGDQDLTLGIDYLRTQAKRFNTPFMSANLLDPVGKPVFLPHKIVERDGAKFGVFAVLANQSADGKPLRLPPGYSISEPGAAAARQVKALRKKGAHYVVGLIHMDEVDQKRLLAATPGIDLALGGHGHANLIDPEAIGSGYRVQAGYRGKHLGQVDLIWSTSPDRAFKKVVDGTASSEAQDRIELYTGFLRRTESRLSGAQGAEKDRLAKKIANYEEQIREDTQLLATGDVTRLINEAIPLSRDVDDHKATDRLVQAAKDVIAKQVPMQRSEVETQLTGAYAGGEVCRACHPKEFSSWSNTRHARAYDTLKEQNRQYDYDCVGCHATGFKDKGGFRDPWAVGSLKNVQCEVCHGPGRDHAKAPKTAKLSRGLEAAKCRQCHSAAQTGDRFKIDAYLPKVNHK